MENKNRTLSKT
ncbi:hypothetical protein F383_04039 [Gossypium arboreum]|uniref:Uncharacterized protein n=1 Tax=Gossypium arboreum TaxID=29729 RepID=A0A0B0PWG6_GOSAR|nr:hypothetical protein F383_04039 [Gossypium arboreum]